MALSAPNALSQGVRQVRGNTIISPELPKAELTFGKDFQYVGARQVNLYGRAEAELHLFAKIGKGFVIEAFYWVQFEHRLPSDQHTYNYPADHTTNIGGLNFVYDAKSWPDFASELTADPASDGAAVSGLLAESKLKFPSRVARVRMFHLPTPDRRTELMIIYGEALPENSSVPVRKEGVDLMKDDPAFAKKLLDDLKAQLTIQTK
jgi:hypothetical protein